MFHVYDPDLHAKVMVTCQNQTYYWSIRFTISFRFSYRLVQVYYITRGFVVDIKQICMSKGKVTGSCQSNCVEKIRFQSGTLLLITVSQGTSVQHCKMCHVQTLPWSVYLRQQATIKKNLLNFHDHRPYLVI